MFFFPQQRALLWAVSVILATNALATTQQNSSDQNVFNQGEVFEVPVDPYQLVLQYDDSDPMSSGDEMMILSTTQDYLSSILQLTEPSFSRLALFQFVRDYPESQHYVKVALSGTVYFSKRSVQIEDIQTDILMSFVGRNMLNFVEALRDAGMTHIVNGTLMSIEGNEMDYRDGEMVQMGISEDESEFIEDSDREMSDDMRMMTLLLSLLIPGAVVCLACSVFACRFIREVNWETPKTTPEAPVWQIGEHDRISEASRRVELKKKKFAEGQMEEA
jgi:hypothetical protein